MKSFYEMLDQMSRMKKTPEEIFLNEQYDKSRTVTRYGKWGRNMSEQGLANSDDIVSNLPIHRSIQREIHKFYGIWYHPPEGFYAGKSFKSMIEDCASIIWHDYKKRRLAIQYQLDEIPLSRISEEDRMKIDKFDMFSVEYGMYIKKSVTSFDIANPNIVNKFHKYRNSRCIRYLGPVRTTYTIKQLKKLKMSSDADMMTHMNKSYKLFKELPFGVLMYQHGAYERECRKNHMSSFWDVLSEMYLMFRDQNLWMEKSLPENPSMRFL